MLQLHPLTFGKNGGKDFVVLPYEEFVALKERLEDLQDLVDLEKAEKEEAESPTRSLDDVAKELGLE